MREGYPQARLARRVSLALELAPMGLVTAVDVRCPPPESAVDALGELGDALLGRLHRRAVRAGGAAPERRVDQPVL